MDKTPQKGTLPETLQPLLRLMSNKFPFKHATYEWIAPHNAGQTCRQSTLSRAVLSRKVSNVTQGLFVPGTYPL